MESRSRTVSRLPARKSVKVKKGSNKTQIQTFKKYKEMPIEFIPNRKVTYTRRFLASSSGNVDLSVADLINTKIMAVTSVLGYSPHYAVRLRNLKLWGPVTTSGTAVTVSVFPKVVETDTNCFGDLPQMISDTSVSLLKPAFIEWSPPKTLPAGSWHYTTSATIGLFKLFYPQGALLELVVEGDENLQTGTLGFTSVLAAASVGGMYCRNVATNFTPISINSI